MYQPSISIYRNKLRSPQSAMESRHIIMTPAGERLEHTFVCSYMQCTRIGGDYTQQGIFNVNLIGQQLGVLAGRNQGAQGVHSQAQCV